MSWFGGGLSNIQGKLTSFTAQVLNDVVETVQGAGDEDSNGEGGRISVLVDDVVTLKAQNDELMKKNHDLETQVASLSRQYRNLLSSSKGPSDAPETSGEVPDIGEPRSVEQDPWWADLEQWVKSQNLVLPQSLNDRILKSVKKEDGFLSKSIPNEAENRKCQLLEQRIASLEKELESLDEQHQDALEAALSTIDQLRGENRQYKLKLTELMSEADKYKEHTAHLNEHKNVENGENSEDGKLAGEKFDEVLLELEKYKESVSSLTAKLLLLEDVQQQNVSLNSQLSQLNEVLSELTLTHKTAESKLTEENNELQAKIATLTNQNQLLSSMTSVLDRITEENRLLETNLEAVSDEVKSKVVEINKLKDELAARSEASSISLTEEKSTGTERAELPDMETAELRNEYEILKKKLVEVEKVKEESENCKFNFDQMSENFNSLQTELATTKEALRSSELRAENLANERIKLMEKLESVSKSDPAADSSVEMTHLIESLNSENTLLKQKVELLESAHSETKSQLDSLAQVRRDLEEDLSETREEFQRLKLRFSELEIANSRREAELNVLNSDLVSSNQTIDSFKIELERIENERTSLHKQVVTLQGQIEENSQSISKEDAATAVDFYTDEINKISQENAELKSRIQDLIVERQRMEEQTEVDKNTRLEQLKSAETALEHSKLQEEDNKKEREKLIDELEAIREKLRNSLKQVKEQEVKCDQQTGEIERLNSETRHLKEALAIAEKTNEQLTIKNEELQDSYKSQTKILNELNYALETLQDEHRVLVEEKLNDSEKESRALALSQELAQKEQEVVNLQGSMEILKSERDHFTTQLQESDKEKELLRDTLQAFQQQREQLVQTVQQKHQEAVNYHTETLKLAKVCEELQMKLNEKTALEQEINQLVSENEALKASQGQWQTEMERLRSHLLSVEESYTQELLNSQSKEKVLRDSLQAAEERANEQSRVGDQLSAWQEKYRKSLADKDRLEKENIDKERSLERLQNALQQLTREKERDIVVAQKELLLKLSKAESVQNGKEAEIVALRRKLGEAQQGLDAASRLTQQLDKTKEALAAAKEQASTQEKELQKIRQQMEKLQAGTDSKVDKSLVKNLLIGYFSAPSAKHKQEVLRIVATVMDFSPEDRHKTGIEDSTGGLTGWASGLLKSRTRTSSGNSSVGDADKSLSEAFISFLESESARPSPPRLPVQQPAGHSPGNKGTTSMTTFQPGRNEPTILRDILRDSES